MAKETIYSNDTSNNKKTAIKKLFIIQTGVKEKLQETIAKIQGTFKEVCQTEKKVIN